VRPYRPVRRPGEEPCRGSRIDLLGNGEAVAVDGFRCRRSDGNAWLITEPEIVLAQDGAPLDLRGTVSPDDPQALPNRGPDDLRVRVQEALEPDSAFFSPGEVPPVPRRAPRETIVSPVAQTATEDDETAAFDAETTETAEEAAGDGSPVDEVADGIAALPLPSATAPPVPDEADIPTPPADAAEGGPSSERMTTAALREVTPSSEAETDSSAGLGVVRIPGPDTPDSRSLTATPGSDAGGAQRRPRIVDAEGPEEVRTFTGDPRILDALRDLAYLRGGGSAPPASAVQSAIDAFARDERFALPVSASALLSRLDGAIARREALLSCASAPSDVPCIVSE